MEGNEVGSLEHLIELAKPLVEYLTAGYVLNERIDVAELPFPIVKADEATLGSKVKVLENQERYSARVFVEGRDEAASRVTIREDSEARHQLPDLRPVERVQAAIRDRGVPGIGPFEYELGLKL